MTDTPTETWFKCHPITPWISKSFRACRKFDGGHVLFYGGEDYWIILTTAKAKAHFQRGEPCVDSADIEAFRGPPPAPRGQPQFENHARSACTAPSCRRRCPAPASTWNNEDNE